MKIMHGKCTDVSVIWSIQVAHQIVSATRISSHRCSLLGMLFTKSAPRCHTLNPLSARFRIRYMISFSTLIAIFRDKHYRLEDVRLMRGSVGVGSDALMCIASAGSLIMRHGLQDPVCTGTYCRIPKCTGVRVALNKWN
jgi:hypothetical protein